jgi:hypothetical protein
MQLKSEKGPLYVAPVASTSFLRAAYWDGATSSVRFTYRTVPSNDADAEVRNVGIQFRRAMLFQKRAESFCRVEHIEGCYDSLVEVEASAWLEEEYSSKVRERARMKEIHHYKIYLDSVGCFEVLAESWNVSETKQEQDVQ